MAFERVKEFKDLTLHYVAEHASGMTMKFHTDMPGGNMALRVTLNFPQKTTRGTLTLPLDGWRGTLYRLLAESSGVVELYGGVIRCRPIGVYFDGARGEVWDSEEQGIGI